MNKDLLNKIKVAQTIVDEYRDPAQEVSYRDIMHRVKEMKIPYNGPDIADITAQYLPRKGIKVWR